MIKAIIDTNVILDIALKREPFFEYSSQIFNKIDDQLLEGFITVSSITDIYYIARKQRDKYQARMFLMNLIQVLDVIGIDRDIVVNALVADMPVFEDAIQVYSGKAYGIDLIITRNIDDFSNSGIEVKSRKSFYFNSKIRRRRNYTLNFLRFTINQKYRDTPWRVPTF